MTAPNVRPMSAAKKAGIPIYGAPLEYGKCLLETHEQASFFNRLRSEYPDTWGRLGIHVRNEGKRTHWEIRKIKAEGGFIAGSPDIVIPGVPPFLCEMKARSKASKTTDEQIAYLQTAREQGAFACFAYGAEAAWQAFEEWLGE